MLDISTEDFVERDLMLQDQCHARKRMEIVLLVEMFQPRGRYQPADIMIEISGQERKIEKFIDLMRPYGSSSARTGRIALARHPGPGDVL